MDSLKRALAALALAGIASCAGSSEARLGEAYRVAERDIRRGQLEAADERLDQALAESESRGEALWSSRLRLLRADLQILRLDFASARSILEAPVPDAPEYAPVRARQKYLLARVQVAQAQLKQAGVTLDEALAIAPADEDLRLDIEILQSQIRFRLGQWAEAEGGLRDLVRRAAAAGDSFRQAQALVSLGMGFVIRSRFDEALPLFESVLQLGDLAGTGIYGGALNNAGLCYARLGQFEKAIALQQQAIETHRNGRQLDYQQALGELGSTYFLQDDIEKSVGYIQQALAIATSANLPTEASLWARNLAAAHIALGNWDDAARFNNEASRLGHSNEASRRAFAAVTSAQIAAGRGQANDAVRQFQEALTLADKTPAVRWIAFDGLARLAVAGRRFDEAARHFEAALDTVEKTRSALLRADYRLSFPTRLVHFYGAYVDLLLSQGRIERALEIADSSRGRVLAERQGAAAPARTTVAALKRIARSAGTTLLFYWLAPERSLVWVVTGDEVSMAATLPPRDDIAALVTEHQAVIQSALGDPLAATSTAGDRLYAALIAPVERHIPHGGTVTIVPDGALHRLNFETLTVGTPKRYWIENVTVQIAPSLAMLQYEVARSVDVRLKPDATTKDAGGPVVASGFSRTSGSVVASGFSRTSAVPGRLLLVGNPAPRPPEFPALGYAPQEMAGITKHFGSDRITTIDGERASPEAFRNAGPKAYSVIHFTAHAVANTETPLDSAVILSGPDQAYKLYAREVAGMPLAADLVTVSACRSAGERAYAGEGLVGFAWAFLRAGARRVVAGLWDVDDRSTAMLMDQMYAGLAKGLPPARALREAKLALIEAGFPKAYYWAPFQLFTLTL
jgi:CHAT domain-containing protein/tetratricopeptide (TPR) repeat protein